MSILKLFRFFRPTAENLDPLPGIMTQPIVAECTTEPPKPTEVIVAKINNAPAVTIRFEVSCRSPSPRPSQDRDPRIKPLVDVANVGVWRSPETEKYWMRITGTEHYEVECFALFGSESSEGARVAFEAMLVPEENFHDPNAVAVYRLRGGQVGHVPRYDSAEWRALIDEMHQLANEVPSCRAEAKRVGSYPVDDIQIRLELTLPILRAEMKARRPKKPRANRRQKKG
jgi:hypothetical protein